MIFIIFLKNSSSVNPMIMVNIKNISRHCLIFRVLRYIANKSTMSHIKSDKTKNISPRALVVFEVLFSWIANRKI